jgi:hypothetical protein
MVTVSALPFAIDANVDGLDFGKDSWRLAKVLSLSYTVQKRREAALATRIAVG